MNGETHPGRRGGVAIRDECNLSPAEGDWIHLVHMVATQGEGAGEIDQGAIRKSLEVSCGEIARDTIVVALPPKGLEGGGIHTIDTVAALADCQERLIGEGHDVDRGIVCEGILACGHSSHEFDSLAGLSEEGWGGGRGNWCGEFSEEHFSPS